MFTLDIIVITCPNRKLITDFSNQSFKDFTLVVVNDVEFLGPAYARNQGARHTSGDFILFSDDDIIWKPNSVEILYNALANSSDDVAYVYSSFLWDNRVVGHHIFDADLLKKRNYITANSMIKRKDFIGFDEKCKRLSDWDLWLSLLERGKKGLFCGEVLFRTFGKWVSSDKYYSYNDALKYIKNKHAL